MADVFKFIKGFFGKDAKEPVDIPIKYIDNGDGTYSEMVSVAAALNLEAAGLALESTQQTAVDHLATIATAQAPDKETPYILFRVKDGMSFTGASSGDPIIAILTINTLTNTLVSNTPIWYNGNTKQQLVDANVDTSKLTTVSANALTLSELASLGLATSQLQLDILSKLSEVSQSIATTSWSVSTTSATILPQNLNRIGVTIDTTKTTADIYLLFMNEGTASQAALGFSVCIPPGSYWELPTSLKYQGDIVAVGSATNGFISIVESGIG